MTSATITSNKQFLVHLVDTTDEQGQPCEWCCDETNTCVANLYIGEEGDLHHSCFDCIPTLLDDHTGERPAIVELARDAADSTKRTETIAA